MVLQELHIENLALIDKLDLIFQPGFNVLTGETGAGKSIIIDAVTLVLGGRAVGDFIREGAEEALAEGVFDLSPSHPVRFLLRELGLEPPAGESLILTREISRSGRHRCRVNGRVVTLQTLEEIGRHLVDLHGQHEHQSLLHPSRQMDLLDAFGGEKLLQAKAKVAELYRQWQKTYQELKSLEEDEALRAKREEVLRFQVQEIREAKLEVGEEERLVQERFILQNAEKLYTSAQQAYQALYEGEGEVPAALDQLAAAMEAVEEIARIDQDLAKTMELLEGARYQVEEVARTLASYRNKVEFDPQRLAEIEERLDLLSRLKRKYGPTLEEVIAFGEKAAQELENMSRRDERREELQREILAVEEKLGEAAMEVGRLRREAARSLEEGVMAGLGEVNMPRSVFAVEMVREPAAEGEPAVEVDGKRWRIGPHGAEHVEFLLSANPGEPPRPLARIASGGELSRVMLVLKTLLAAVDEVSTLIFDEVDTGISGRTAQAVAEKMSRLAAKHQVICVTHLPQLASMADHHVFVEKVVEGGRTRVLARSLRPEERVDELARLLGGAKVTDVTRQHAREMMSLAQQVKKAPI